MATASTNASRTIDTAKDDRRRFVRDRGSRRLCIWRIAAMVLLSNHFTSRFVVVHETHCDWIARFFCSGWTLPSSPSRRRVTTAATSAFPTFQQLQQRLHGCNSFQTMNDNGRLGFCHTASTFSTRLLMVKARWQVGDLVQIVSKTNESQRGEVIAIRGSGWFSIRLLSYDSNDNDSFDKIIKCRGSKLQRLAFDTNDGRTLPNHDTGSDTFNIRNENSDACPPATSPPLPLEIEHAPVSMMCSEDLDDEVMQPPAIHDLDAEVCKLEADKGGPSHRAVDEQFLRQAAHHATYEKWVVFSDLHCSPSTLETCLEVLDAVHETAVQRKRCGVLFLGDFWHHRGTLRVDCLNAILNALRSWTVPMVMIPGNHDQVTLGGENHGLTPLGNAYRVGNVGGPLILSAPTVFRNALFVPHIKDTALMKATLRSNQAREASALFLHAEVKGALMNDLVVSTNGISPSVFPSDRKQRIYSGHFHKPHSIETTSSSTIEYIGSPYQVSLSEAHQQKQLVVLDSNWECHERIPLCIGKRHFKVSSFEELDRLQMDWDETATKESFIIPPADDNHHDDDDASYSGMRVKKGDRVVINLPPEHHPSRGTMVGSEHGAMWKSRVQSLREHGLMVELREPSDVSKDPSTAGSSDRYIPDFEELSPESVWKAYLNGAKTRESIHEKDCGALLKAGLQVLEELEESSSSTPDAIRSRETQMDLRLTSMSVTGFGPFEDTIEYPLDNRGLVLLRGSNVDSGPDSNGTGKSSLAMATLWALTGSLDARPASDLKVSDVINDNSRAAKVTVEGFINDSPFILTRSKTASKGDLTFRINDVDLTTQSAKDTQSIVEERLGVDNQILTRVAFYGQHGRNDLLEATDSKLKDELSIVVPLDLWQQASSMARAKSRQAKKRVDELEGMLRLRKTDIDALSHRATRAKETRDIKRHRVMQAEERLNRELERIQDLLEQTSDSNVDGIQAQLEDISGKIETLNDLHDSTTREKESYLKPLEEACLDARDDVAVTTRRSTAFETDARASKRSLDSARVRMRRVQEKWSLDASREIPSLLKTPERCPTCKQLLNPETSGEEAIKITQEAMKREVHEAQENMQSAENAYEEASSKASECLDHLRMQEKLLRDVQAKLQSESSRWNARFQDLQEQFREQRKLQNAFTTQLSMVVKESQLLAEREAVRASFQTEKLNAAHAEEIYQNLEKELEIAVGFVEQVRSDKDDEENRQVILSSIGERFGQRGVQTFLLQNTVDSLQRVAQTYLSYLSEDSQRLELSLDAGDRIVRGALVRGADGAFRKRPLSALSGGQWRRCSLALSLAFAELVAGRGRLRSSLLVLDEPLTHLDRSGRERFGKLVRTLLGRSPGRDGPHPPSLRISTAIVILQDLSAEELEEAFDGIDTVVRKDGKSCLSLDEMSSSNSHTNTNTNSDKHIPVS